MTSSEGASDSVSKRDLEFLHYLAMFDARMHVSEFRRLAERDLPGTPLSEIVVLIDQSVVPSEYSVKPLKNYRSTDQPVTSASEVERNEALVAKVQANPERYTIVDMTIAGGSALQMVMTLATGGFWMLDAVVPRKKPTERLYDSLGNGGDEFAQALRWVFQAAEEFEQSDLRREMKKLGIRSVLRYEIHSSLCHTC